MYNECYALTVKLMKLTKISLDFFKEYKLDIIFDVGYDNTKLLLNCLKFDNDEIFDFLYNKTINDERVKLLNNNYNNFNDLKNELLKTCVFKFDNNVLEKLIKKIDINKSDNLILYNSLDFVCRTGDYQKFLTLVKVGGDKIIFSNNNNLLSVASKFGHIKIVKYLLDNGVNIHIFEDKALRFTCRFNHFKMVKYLIKRGANIHARNNYALSVSLFNNSYKVFNYLIKKGADIHYHDDVILLDCFNEEYIDNFKYLLYEKNLNIHCNNDYIITKIQKPNFKINKELLYIIIPYFYHYTNLNLSDPFFNIYRFNNCNNKESQKLYDNYQLLKKQLINRINLNNY